VFCERSRHCPVLIAVVLVLAGLLAGCDWPMYRGGAAHTGRSGGERVIGVGNVATLSEAWTTPDVFNSRTVGSPPVVAGGRMYVWTFDDLLTAYDARGIDSCGGSPKVCQPVWQADPGGQTTPAVVGGVVYVTTSLVNGAIVDGVLSAYDATGATGCSGSPPTCQPLWTAPLGAGTITPASPTVVGGVVYVTADTLDGAVLFAFDAAGQQGCSGTPTVCVPLWTAEFGRQTVVNPEARSPAVANGRVFVSGADFTVYAFDAAGLQSCGGVPKECSALSTYDVPPFTCDSSDCLISGPAVARGVLYVTGDARDGTGGLYAFDARGVSACGGSPGRCSPLWTANAAASTHPPAIADGVVYTVGVDPVPLAANHRLRAFDAAGVEGCMGAPKVCAPLWTSTSDQLTSPPTVANGVVYATSFTDIACDPFCEGVRHLLAFDASGVEGCSGTPTQCSPLLDMADARGLETFTDPIIANGILYVREEDFDPSAIGVLVTRAYTPEEVS